MRKHTILMLAIALPLTLAGCGGTSSGYASVNINEVLERITKTLVNFDAYLRRYDYEKVDKAMFEQFNTTIQHDLNAKPTFHKTMIVTQMAKDASIIGFGDLNKNGKVDLDEPKLFKIEMDPDNDRVIVTSASGGQATGRTMGRSGGFFAGVMIGSLLNRQGSAGIKRGHFDSRRVANAPIAARKVASRGGRTGGSRARSGARSGGIRGGK
ncbi:MAG: hypothetical protein ACI89J_001371 [Hyphomicrobiaceae bacterium]|jgi:hypothetical protein